MDEEYYYDDPVNLDDYLNNYDNDYYDYDDEYDDQFGEDHRDYDA